MSETILNTISNAVPYNQMTIPRLFSGLRSLPAKFRGYPVAEGLDSLFDRDCGSDLFTRDVLKLQENLGFPKSERDAKFGRGTLTALLLRTDRITKDYVTLEGGRHKVTPQGWEMVSFDQEGGLDLHRRGHFSRRKESTTTLCFHWGGLNPKHFFNVAMSPSRRISSHFGIGKNEKGIVQVYQFLDMSLKAWHCGRANGSTIGIDICQQAEARWFDHYSKSGIYQVEMKKNPSTRGKRKIISLDPEILWAVQDFTRQLEAILEENIVAYTGGRPIPDCDEIIGLDQVADYRIIGHHHLRAHKWDIAPWWDELFA